MKYCPRCKAYKERVSFGKSGSYCKPCRQQYAKDWAERYAENQRKSYHKNKEFPERRLRLLLSSSRHDRSAIDFDWAWSRLESNDFRCEITGMKFVYEARHPKGLSIDKIDPSKGYTKDNVRFVCWWMNAAMGGWGLDKLKELIKEWQN